MGLDAPLLLRAVNSGISGTVVDERGLPIESFLVSIEHATLADGSRAPGGMQRRFTDAEGAFKVDRLGVGRWTLVVSAAGRPGTKVEVPVEAGKTTEDVRVRLERGATLVGSVIDRQTRRGIGGAVRNECGSAAAAASGPTLPTRTSRVLCRGLPGTRWAFSSRPKLKREAVVIVNLVAGGVVPMLVE